MDFYTAKNIVARADNYDEFADIPNHLREEYLERAAEVYKNQAKPTIASKEDYALVVSLLEGEIMKSPEVNSMIKSAASLYKKYITRDITEDITEDIQLDTNLVALNIDERDDLGLLEYNLQTSPEYYAELILVYYTKLKSLGVIK